MSFSFGSNNIPPQIKAQASYKDGSGMGGGGMYFKQGKRKDQPDEDMFEFSQEDENEFVLDGEIDEKDIPQDNIVNKFVNWFRQGKNQG